MGKLSPPQVSFHVLLPLTPQAVANAPAMGSAPAVGKRSSR